MAKVIKGDKQYAIIVSQREFDVVCAMIGTLSGTQFESEFGKTCWETEFKPNRKTAHADVLEQHMTLLKIKPPKE